MDKNQKAHSQLVKDLESKVKNCYQVTSREIEVREPITHKVIGEIDLLGIIGNKWDIYEVKTGDNRGKAREQLLNLRRYLRNCGEITLYYYSGKHNDIEKIE